MISYEFCQCLKVASFDLLFFCYCLFIVFKVIYDDIHTQRIMISKIHDN